jgi:hypothetical protein
MPEATSNVEFAHRVGEQEHSGSGDGRGKWIGMAEAIVLAIVAVATAWSGYQASQWDALSAKNYALSGSYTVLSQAKSTLAGQDRLYDIVTFNGWVAAKVAGRDKVVDFYVRRFRPEYAAAFGPWLRLDPFHNRAAPAGPIFMPQYKDVNALASLRLAATAGKYFDTAVSARERGDDYVRVTVFLATVLFLTALSQRFDFAAPRVAVVTVAAILLSISAFWIIILPRI